MMPIVRSFRWTLAHTGRALASAALALTLGVAACGTTDVEIESPLDGFAEATATDSAGNPLPPPTGTGPGSFRGTVLGPSAPGAGNDSLATAPRIAGVRVTAYPLNRDGVVGEVTADIGLPIAHVFTDSLGVFQMPTLPSGRYAVLFAPSDGSGYAGVYVTTEAHPTSNATPWWVVLPRLSAR
ncbi:MAG: hypothetical protein IT357_15130 [Gemmatimonadaceae bacterium]|nr:hypothetical protein [Gemmatimonadaceae bacterium]